MPTNHSCCEEAFKEAIIESSTCVHAKCCTNRKHMLKDGADINLPCAGKTVVEGRQYKVCYNFNKASIVGSFMKIFFPAIRENVDLLYIQGGASGMGGSGGFIIHEFSVVCLCAENAFARLVAVLTRSFQLSMFWILDERSFLDASQFQHQI